ncbi:MAG: glycosyltransferase [Chlorobiaceae bacterium]
MNVLHYNTATGWRGGEQQALYLMRQLSSFPLSQYSMGLPDSPFLEKTAPYVQERFPAASRGEINPGVTLALLNVIKKHRIDIVHTHTTPAHSMALQAKLLYNGFTLVVHRRVDFPIKNNPLSLYKYKSGKVDRIISVSECIRGVLVSQGVPPSKIETIYDGVDPDRLKADHAETKQRIRSEYRIEPDTIILGMVAALTGNKDHLTLLRALYVLLQKGVKCKLFIIGDGEEKSAIISEIGKLGLENQVIMPGYRSDLEKFIGAFDLYINSSKTEGLGTSIIDALANGIPVVATAAGGVPELLGESEFGLLVEKQNPEALAAGIARMIAEPGMMRRYQKAGIARAARFSVGTMAEKTFQLYQKLSTKAS